MINDMNNMNAKPLIQSKTVTGATAMLAAYFAALLAGEQSAYSLVEIVTSVGVCAGWALAIYGRIVANEPIAGVLQTVVTDLQAQPPAADESHE